LHNSTPSVLAKSSLYRTAPIDAGGDDYFNCVVKLDTTLPVRHLLALCHKIEHQFGRERPFRNAPRTLDLDILLYGDQSIDEPDLIVPHPRLDRTRFCTGAAGRNRHGAGDPATWPRRCAARQRQPINVSKR
jgi:2-amino-4-hydroxy-6-hydroxymethyldihydropteridine diphosphokinase